MLWSHQVEYLGDVARCTVANVSAGESIDAFARAVLDQAPEKFAVCGLPLGGIVAQQILQLAPERVERLALVDTTAIEFHEEMADLIPNAKLVVIE